MFHLPELSSFLQIQKIRHDMINLNTASVGFCQAVFKWQAIAVIKSKQYTETTKVPIVYADQWNARARYAALLLEQVEVN